jgi:hypothetical protein
MRCKWMPSTFPRERGKEGKVVLFLMQRFELLGEQLAYAIGGEIQ